MSGAAAAWRVEDLPPLLDMLFASSSLGISFFDRDLRFVYVNDALAAVGGLPPSAYVDRLFEDVLPEPARTVVPYLRTVLDTGAPLLDRRFRVGPRHWLVSYYPVRAPAGALLGVGAVAQDETERRDAERLLRQSEERYRALVDMCPDAIVEVEDEHVAFVNRAAVELIGATSADALVGRCVWDFLLPTDLVPAQTQFADAMERREYLPFETRLRRFDGRELLVHVRGAVYDRSGRAAMQAVLRDVTDQRAAEREREQLIATIATERELVTTVLRQLPAGVIVVDAATSRLVLANRAAERIWGKPFGERELSPPEPDRPNWPLLATMRDGLVSAELEAEVRCGDGAMRILRGGSAPIRNAEGAVVAAVATFRDVTDERRADEALRLARDELEQRVTERTASLAHAYAQLRHEVTEREQVEQQLRTADRLASIGTFAAGIAHEINNPLAAILATAELARALVAEGAPPEHLDTALARIVTEARRGGQIVKGILRFAREEEVERGPVDVNEVVHAVCALVQEPSARRGCVVRTRLARRLPRVVMKPTELEQALVNLVQNAKQAGASTVLVQTGSSGGRVWVRIRDDGRGIAKKHLDRVFDPFFTTRGRDGGTGLGLSIVHGIVTGYDGAVRVQSRAGRGTTFTIELPVDATAPAEAAPTSE